MQLHRPYTHTNTRIVAIAREIDFLNANALHMSDEMRLEKSRKNVAKKKRKCEKKADKIPQQFEVSFFACFSFTLQLQVSFPSFFYFFSGSRKDNYLLAIRNATRAHWQKYIFIFLRVLGLFHSFDND